MTMRRVVGGGLILVLAIWAIAATGTEATGDLFALGVSARALGLGGAFTGLADDEACILYNPAGAAFLERIGVSSLYVAQFGGVTEGSVVVAGPWAGVAVMFLDSGLIPDGDDGFRYSSQGIVAGGGIPIGPVALGVRWRLLRVSSPFTGSGWSIDPAIAVSLGVLRLGLVYEGALSTPIRYSSGSEEDWEQGLRLGAVVTLSPFEEVQWTLAVDGIGLLGPSPQLALGIESWIGGVGGRIGYDGEGPTVGLSVKFSGLEVDWGYAMRSDLGDSHRVSVTIRF